MKIQREIFLIAIKKNELLKIMSGNSTAYTRMVHDIVDKLGIDLQEPEKEIVKQGSEDAHLMYFVQKGQCDVLVQDKIGSDSGLKRVRSLISGDHFGVSVFS